jgi:hypothetical protein
MSAGDTLAFSEEFRIMSERGGYPDRCLIYVHYALQYQSAKLTQMDPPTQDALQQIAAEVGPRYESYVQPDVMPLIEILETVWQYRDPQRGAKGNSLVIRGCIALAVMLKQPESDLYELEMSLRRYIDNNNDSLIAYIRDMQAKRSSSLA